MTVFGIVALVGTGVLLLSLLFGDLFDTDGLDLVGGWFSMPVLAAFVAAFGITGATATAVGAGFAAASIAGAVVGAGLAAALGYITRAVLRGRNDATPADADLVGLTGVVLSDIPAGGYGRVRVELGGQPVHLNARSGAPLPRGVPVFVIDTLSASAVLVEPLPGSPDLGRIGR